MRQERLLPGQTFIRPLGFAGIVLAGLGGIVLLRGGSFVSPQHLFMMGDLISASGQQQLIPPWVGGVGLLAGGLLIMTGAWAADASSERPVRVLMVLTSHHLLGDTGKRTGFWLEEFAAPYYMLKDGGVAVTLASPKGGHPPVDPASDLPEHQTGSTRRFRADAAASTQLAHTLRLNEMRAGDFDAVFYPGGHGPMWDLPDNAESIALLEAFVRAGKPVGAVCHGPAALLNVRGPDGDFLLRHKRVTGFSNAEETAASLTTVVPFLLEDRLTARGALYHKAANWVPNVQVDGRLVTGQNPSSSAQAAGELLALVSSRMATYATSPLR